MSYDPVIVIKLYLPRGGALVLTKCGTGQPECAPGCGVGASRGRLEIGPSAVCGGCTNCNNEPRVGECVLSRVSHTGAAACGEGREYCTDCVITASLRIF